MSGWGPCTLNGVNGLRRQACSVQVPLLTGQAQSAMQTPLSFFEVHLCPIGRKTMDTEHFPARQRDLHLFKTPGTCVARRDRSLELLHLIIFQANLCNCSERVPPLQLMYTTTVELTWWPWRKCRKCFSAKNTWFITVAESLTACSHKWDQIVVYVWQYSDAAAP